MTQAENYAILFEGGSKNQAQKLAKNMSIWEEQGWKSETTIFGFEDGSAVYVSGPEFRVATDDEIAACK